ncbi:MAG TPA: polysaccharide deacetylase family protein [Longimicrobium sp.]|nr:polysaccharide deacetylase family protein [Longimicrobium sp.]
MSRSRSYRRVLAAVALLVFAAPLQAQRANRDAPVRGGIPVLAWHYFKDAPEPGDGNLTESYAAFEAMLRFLKEHGFRSVFPEDARLPADGGGRQVILTFDDGHRDHVRVAEVLERHGFRGIFFVIPGRTRAESDRFLTAADVERLARAGHRVAAHGWEHRSLPASGTEVGGSMARSPAVLEEHTGADAAPDFAFPFGHYTPEVAEALNERYVYLHTVNPGYWDALSPLVPRMLIMTDVDPAIYRDYLLGGARYAPRLEPLTPDGAVADSVAFLVRGGRVPENVELFAISADAEGRSYVRRPLGERLRVRGDTAWVDVGGYLRAFHGPTRIVLSFALVVPERGGALRYLSPGVMYWRQDPAAVLPRPRPDAPPPASADTAAPPPPRS